ncbi:MAG: DUF1501 domain-containing protein [Verrucomicrobia bacterium]|nr:DUF1501 domain-containing protein [Verrucomicrobiota bacterium]
MKHDPISHMLEHMVSRRQLLRSGSLAAAGLMLGKHLGMASQLATPAPPTAKAKAVIQIWLWGGPSHLDTFDPKPDAGNDYCGPLNKPLATNVDGIVISELMPELAKQADKYSLIRSMTHGSNGHETAAYMVQTGHAEGDRLVYPSMGAVVSLLKGYDGGYKGLVPPYIVLTEPQGRFSEAGFLGPSYKPFATGGDPSKTPFAVQGIVAEGISGKRQEQRRKLLHNMDALSLAMKQNQAMLEFHHAEEGAYDMIMGDGAKIFDVTSEGDKVRQWYGTNTFGQSCLVARRLIERGVRFVTINFKGWDSHKQNFQTMRTKLPQLDAGLAALIQDLSSRGLLDSTIVWCGGEFGRTPKVQWEEPWGGGRGHWGRVFSTFIAGGGFRGGQIVGASDARGEEVKDRPVYPWDLLGSMYEQLGIDPDAKFPRMSDGNVRITQAISGEIKSGGRLREIM